MRKSCVTNFGDYGDNLQHADTLNVSTFHYLLEELCVPKIEVDWPNTLGKTSRNGAINDICDFSDPKIEDGHLKINRLLSPSYEVLRGFHRH